MALTLSPGDVFTAAEANSLAVRGDNETITGQWGFTNYVGVNTTSPTAWLDLRLAASSYTDSTNVLMISDALTIGHANIRIGVNATTNIAFIQAHRWSTGWSNLTINPNGGDVGVGVNPIYALDVNGSCRISNNLAVGTTPTAYPFEVKEAKAGDFAVGIENTSGTGYGMFIRSANDALDVLRIISNTGTANVVKIYGSGYTYFAGLVSIGAEPSGNIPFRIRESTYDHLDWESSTYAFGRLGKENTTDGILILYSSNSAKLKLHGNGQFESLIATGTKPIAVTSTTLCDNLNADMVDGVHTKIIDIGTWDMHYTTPGTGSLSKNVAHGLTLSKIRTISVLIRNDTNDSYCTFDYGEGLSGYIIADATNIQLAITAADSFDSASFSTTAGSYNRGWITIQYIP